MMGSCTSTIAFECASTLTSLSSSNAIIKAAANSYAQLLTTSSDNNVKLIVLDRLTDLKSTHTLVLQDMLMDIMRALSSPNLDLRRKILDLTVELVSPRSIDDVVVALKKEVIKTQTDESDKSATEYRQLLVRTIHSCTVKFPDTASSFVHVLLDFIVDSSAVSAAEVISFVKEVLESFPALRPQILQRLFELFGQIRVAKVCCPVLCLMQ